MQSEDGHNANEESVLTGINADVRRKRSARPANGPVPPPLFPMPPSASTPVTSHFDAILECHDLLSCMEENSSVDKQDVIDSIRSMLNTMLSTVMMHNFSTSMSVQGWRVQ